MLNTKKKKHLEIKNIFYDKKVNTYFHCLFIPDYV